MFFKNYNNFDLLKFLVLVLNGSFLPFQQKFCSFFIQLSFYFFFISIWCFWLFFFFFFLNPRNLFHHSLFIFNFMPMTLLFLLHFLNNLFSTSFNLFSHNSKIIFGVILCFSNSILQSLILFILACLSTYWIFFHTWYFIKLLTCPFFYHL